MPQDPAVIQRQIEETRAELAETIDAITEVVSPRRIAERTQEQIRARAAELRQRYGPALGLGPGAPELAAKGGVFSLRGGLPTAGGALPAGATSPTAALVRVVRWDRVALVGSGLLVFAGGVRRRRRRGSRRG